MLDGEKIIMTLILAAYSHKGYSIVSDKRNTETFLDGRKEYTDNLIKIYTLQDTTISIYNHGINKINGTYWMDAIKKFEKNNSLKDLSFDDVVKKISEYFNNLGLLNEVRDNKIDNYSSYVILGKGSEPNGPKAVELKYESDVKCDSLGNFIRSGKGDKYMITIINSRKNINTNEYWQELDAAELEMELIKLFKEAHTLMPKDNGEEFSKTYNSIKIYTKKIDDIDIDRVDLDKHKINISSGTELYRIVPKGVDPLKPTGEASRFAKEPSGYTFEKYQEALENGTAVLVGTGATYYCESMPIAILEVNNKLEDKDIWRVTLKSNIEVIDMDFICKAEGVPKPYTAERTEIWHKFYGKKINGLRYESS